MAKNKNKMPVDDSGAEPESQIVDEVIPVTKPKLKCIFVSDGVYKHVEDTG